MGLATGVIFDVRPGGSDTNGGGYKEGASGTNWSKQDAAQYSVTDGVTNGTATITSATANFGTDVVGNVIYIEGGTGAITPGWYEITSRTNSTTIVVDRSTGLTTGTGATFKIGGAFASPGRAAAVAAAGNRIYVKDGTYTITTTTAGPAGPVSITTSGVHIEGYLTTQGDVGARPVIDAGAQTSVTLVSLTGDGTGCSYIKADGQSGSGNKGFVGNDGDNRFYQCEAVDCDGSGGIGFTSGVMLNCKAQNCATGFSIASGTGTQASYCEAEDCTTGFTVATSAAEHCLAYGGTTGFNMSSTLASVRYCSAIDATTGFTTTGRNSISHCVATGCTTGYSIAGTRTVTVINCYSWNNTTSFGGAGTAFFVNAASNPTTLSGDPWMDSAADDYRPNATAGAGAVLRAAGVGHFSQTNNVDAGAVQHTDPAGGSGGLLLPFGHQGGYAD